MDTLTKVLAACEQMAERDVETFVIANLNCDSYRLEQLLFQVIGWMSELEVYV